ncbi:hypothetical protein B0A55_01859 [Friedmanniomyces simplex]|uniref:F-box domain-containing protein n=1 Tax=Friedmanniomyces simplex TaxID=329884 RepID=A0A4U0XW11_9PEZI|nr:hypothetical protein B0A55_01859 [Friedmanniomyces simplex]
MDVRTATERTFATPELLEYVLSYLLADLRRINYGEDPRSVRTYANTDTLLHLLHCSEVNRTWYQCIQGSRHLQRALFLHPEQRLGRSWDLAIPDPVIAKSAEAPVLNPIIQTLFKTYHFRYWHLSLEASGNKHCAYLIITRRDLPPDIPKRSRTGQGRTISRMLLSQPPCTVLEATIWEERDETKDYVGRTAALREPRIGCEEGLTLEVVHERVRGMFGEHPDVAAIKLTTV